VAFFWGAILLACALVTAVVLINARKEDVKDTEDLEGAEATAATPA
jgi:hypothetical protein